ncbi:M14 family metallopeptidase [Roseateles oligotrophus]|uniref:M14 family metallopeptidase n=1 Tax=Roseateles oligotrophus TaxID=1769250 RepID=A0ABT2Y871_9BURK|nr:M14 family metallopeptidase [Roseateles oligotrophus]MCV2366498.1 M14 family metallopeptidase [Roseateles oligotrophus]
MKAAAHFSQSYAEARAKFLAAAESAGLDNEPHWHPLLGRDGERLAMDVVRQGPRQARRLLIISSACHGVEGFAGSGIQAGLLNDHTWLAAVAASGAAVLYIHALNPHGFSWWRRVTQEGVDLNRNWHDFHRPLPHNAGYDEIAAALIPSQWPPKAAAQALLDDYAARHGDKGLQAAITGGQYEHELGLFYGGRAPTWSQQTLRHVLQEQAGASEAVAWIDLHTGLGPSGHGERIFAGHDDGQSLARARRWWGQEITSLADGSSSSAPLVGLMWSVVPELLPDAQYTGIALEFGTLPLTQMIDALRADHWLEAHPEASAAQALAIKQQIRDAFYIDTDDWKQQLLTQAREACGQALRGLTNND